MRQLRLPDIDQVQPLGSADSACLKEVAEVLARHGPSTDSGRFGITLLHDHFELRRGEVASLLPHIDIK